MPALALALCTATAFFAQDPTVEPAWIWTTEATADQKLALRRSFERTDTATRAQIWISCDNHFELWLNGQRVGASGSWENVRRFDVTPQIRTGLNCIAVRCRNDGGPAAFGARLHISSASGGTQDVVSDASWRISSDPDADGWRDVRYDDSDWAAATVLNRVGAPAAVWSSTVGREDFGLRSTAPMAQRPTPAADIQVVDGFRVERLFDVPRKLGSWVALTTGPQGQLFASDQGSRGLVQIEPAATSDDTTRVHRIDVDIGGVQGMTWAFGALYAVVNGKDSGLYKIVDSDGDGALDRADCLARLRGSGEHGPHAVVPSPDGRSLFVVAGNHTALPKDLVRRSRVPMFGEEEDLLLPRQWDARGHARGRLAPGGWICQVSPDGADWELYASGFRNAYDLAFDASGELFTFDSDMEWDMGMPWYRPTRICHVVSGAEFGWRAGSGKWPASSPDAVPGVVDMGPSSPTGLTFGTHARFPARYRHALFALDWTFGTIWAVHLEAEGASFRGTAEAFVSSTPLPVTDTVVGDDGALYFTTGGRGTASALFRVVSTSEPASLPIPPVAAATARRRALESHHGTGSAATAAAVWPDLGAEDRAVRYAARVALETRPAAEWSDRVASEADPTRKAHALLAWARAADAGEPQAWRDAFDTCDLAAMSPANTLVALRALSVQLARHGAGPDAWTRRVTAALEALYPSEDEAVSTALAELLVFSEAPDFVAKAVAQLEGAQATDRRDATHWARRLVRNDRYGKPIRRMLENAPPRRAMHLAFVLRLMQKGWTPETRRTYFEFLQRAEGWAGGASYRGFVRTTRKAALTNCSQEERTALAALTGEPAERTAPRAVAPKGPQRRWSVEDASDAIDGKLRKRDFERGRALFWSAACIACHRFDGEGGSIGPDLTTAGHRFSTEDLLVAIIEPGAYISDQYGSSVVARRDGGPLTGRVIEKADGSVLVYTSDPKAAPVGVAANAIRQISPSEMSQMPAGLIDSFDADDLADLMAYLCSAGNPKSPMHRR